MKDESTCKIATGEEWISEAWMIALGCWPDFGATKLWKGESVAAGEFFEEVVVLYGEED